MKNPIYLTTDYELVENQPENALCVFSTRDHKHYGNVATTFTTEYEDCNPLVINGWHIESFVINRQWNESFIVRIYLKKPNMLQSDFLRPLSSLGLRDEKWRNNGDTLLGLDTKMLKHAIEIIKKIPSQLKTIKGVNLYIDAVKSNGMPALAKFYKSFISSRRDLPESDITFLENFYLEKMEFLLTED